MTYVIENNIPMPSPATGRKKGISKYPFQNMDIGDSFIAPKSARGRVSGMISKFKKQSTMRFSTRASGDGIRVWRIA